MKYYIIAGEASGDLHASKLMEALLRCDPDADFRFVGGEMMLSVDGLMVIPYEDISYMGFVPVLRHLPTIIKSLRHCKRDIAFWEPDAVILVDFPGFNLRIAEHVSKHIGLPVYYYISPKIWAWKEHRIESIRRYVDEMFSILPFEKPFYERKHRYPIHYVGNPTVEEVAEFRRGFSQKARDKFRKAMADDGRPVIALLAGSRRQEIKDNLPAMLKATREFAAGYQIVIAGAPSIPAGYYDRFIGGTGVRVVHENTFPLLECATAALVTSGTATLEAALFGVPQVVCYKTPIPRIIAFLRRRFIKVRYISLVNLIADSDVVPELVADTFSVDNIRCELRRILPGSAARDEMLRGYDEVKRRLGTENASENAARIMLELLERKS